MQLAVSIPSPGVRLLEDDDGVIDPELYAELVRKAKKNEALHFPEPDEHPSQLVSNGQKRVLH